MPRWVNTTGVPPKIAQAPGWLQMGALPGWHVDTARSTVPLQITWIAQYGSQAGEIQPAEVQQEVVVSYLPLSHIAAQMYDLWTGIKWGAQVCFAEPDALKVSLPSALVGIRVCVCQG